MKTRLTTTFLASMALSGSLIACGGSSDDGDDTDDNVTVEGDPHPYVMDSVSVPTTNAQANEIGLDLNGDGGVDNQLGRVLATLKMSNIDAQAALDEAVATGSIILLGDMTTTGFDSATGAGFSIYIGDNPGTAPCTDPLDLATCGLHLDGSTTFDIKAGTPTDGTVAGNFVGGTFTGGPGQLNLQIALSSGSPIDITLQGARAKITDITETTIADGIIAGSVLKTDIDTKILPAVVDLIAPIVADECAPDVGGCNCTAGGSAETVLGLFDADNSCDVTLAEIQSNAIITSLLAPDIDTDDDGEEDAVSLGAGITAVGAVYTHP